MAVGTGLQVMAAMMSVDVEAGCGPKGKHDPARTAVRHGRGDGSLALSLGMWWYRFGTHLKAAMTASPSEPLPSQETMREAWQEFVSIALREPASGGPVSAVEVAAARTAAERVATLSAEISRVEAKARATDARAAARIRELETELTDARAALAAADMREDAARKQLPQYEQAIADMRHQGD